MHCSADVTYAYVTRARRYVTRAHTMYFIYIGRAAGRRHIRYVTRHIRVCDVCDGLLGVLIYACVKCLVDRVIRPCYGGISSFSGDSTYCNEREGIVIIRHSHKEMARTSESAYRRTKLEETERTDLPSESEKKKESGECISAKEKYAGCCCSRRKKK